MGRPCHEVLRDLQIVVRDLERIVRIDTHFEHAAHTVVTIATSGRTRTMSNRMP